MMKRSVKGKLWPKERSENHQNNYKSFCGDYQYLYNLPRGSEIWCSRTKSQAYTPLLDARRAKRPSSGLTASGVQKNKWSSQNYMYLFNEAFILNVRSLHLCPWLVSVVPCSFIWSFYYQDRKLKYLEVHIQ